MIDVAIITAKQEEFDAVLRRFPDAFQGPRGPFRRSYAFRQSSSSVSKSYTVAIVRCVNQGLSEGQNVATDIIEDLEPRLILAVGISGAVPSSDLFLGDVFLPTQIHDFSVGADTPEGREFAIAGSSPPKPILTMIAALAASQATLHGWNSPENIAVARPDIPSIGAGAWTDDPDWNQRIDKAISAAQERTEPKFTDGSLASSDTLQKDHAKFRRILATDRRIRAVDMETAGVSKACHRHDGIRRFMSIRAISDVVGVPREEKWTIYACEVAASFASTLIRSGMLPLPAPSESKDVRAHAVSEVVRIVGLLPHPMPIDTAAQAVSMSTASLLEALSEYVDAAIIRVGPEGLERGLKFHDLTCDGPAFNGYAMNALLGLLTFIERHGRETRGIAQVKNAVALFENLDASHQRLLAPRVFDTLDRPMKALGAKQLVIDLAEKCIGVVQYSNRTRDEAECEARARICGLSWAFQRTGHLDLAANEAQKSLALSQQLNLGTNTAFCNKCLGRLYRLRSERAKDTSERSELLQKSCASLKASIEAFSALEQYGPESSEVGDCYSLLGRTYLVSDDVSHAQATARHATKRITDRASKDFLDLQILLGDIDIRLGAHQSALRYYSVVADSRKDEDFQRSEIVARALIQRARALVRFGQDASKDFAAAAAIWHFHGEAELASTAEWEAIETNEKFPSPVDKLLKAESSVVRVSAYKLYEEQKLLQRRTALSRRVGHDAMVWKRLIKRARENIALQRTAESEA
jgi:nucleoside phosphorylase/tetratricopeptide (TPR) repeat protein